MALKSILLQVFVVLFIIKSGETINCYNCDSTMNPGCADLKPSSGIVPETCSPEKLNQLNTWLGELNKINYFHDHSSAHNVPMLCQKVVGVEENGDRVTARFCQINTGETDPCSIPFENIEKRRSGKIEHCSTCSTDKCNGASTLNFKKFILITLFLVIYQYFK